MIEEILVCLDGSLLAEKILTLAQSMASAQRATLSLFSVVRDAGELMAQESYLRDTAKSHDAQIKFAVSKDPARAIIDELNKTPGAIAAMTTHGRTAASEALMGSIAFSVMRGSERPVLLFRPLGNQAEAPKRITALVIALDGSEFAEKIIPFALDLARCFAAGVTLIQALPVKTPAPPSALQKQTDLLESSYLHRQASAIKRTHGIDVQWDVLHGDPADAICRHVIDMPDTMLAMTSHGRGSIQRALLGSIAGECIRKSGVPVLLYWPG